MVAVVGGLLAVSGGFVGVAVATETAPQCSTVGYTQNGSGWNEVENVSQLQCIDANGLGEDYVLIGDIDASGTNQWNGGAGFEPIANGSTFTGSFDGAGHTITTLTIDRPSSSNPVGLFSGVKSTGTVSNLTLEESTISANNTVGALVGNNKGMVRTVAVTGEVEGNQDGGAKVALLVGNNRGSGTIEASSVSGSINGSVRVGGLAGINRGRIQNSNASVEITADNQVGGIAGTTVGAIRDSSVNGTITGMKNVGGVVGWNRGAVSTSYATGGVTGVKNVGGLVGFAGQDSNINRSNATGTVSGEEKVGGLVGWNREAVSTSYATGGVTGVKNVGGLVGFAGQDSVVNSSSASGVVSADDSVGGLVGFAGQDSVVNSSNASGVVSADDSVGGLVGYTNGTVTASTASGTVSGRVYVGGLVGSAGSPAMINRSSASGNVSAPLGFAGGLVGYLEGTVERSTASGDIEATASRVGGLVGYAEQDSIINRSNATGTVSGEERVGGLVGRNRGAVSTSYATGGVTGGQYVGGLIGFVDGTVEDTYAAPTAAIRGDERVGGLVGYIDDTGQVNRSFATGLVNATGSKSGGITPPSPGAVSDSYWNAETTNQSSSGGGIPLTTVQMTGDDALDDGNMDVLDNSVWATTSNTDSARFYPTLIVNLQTPAPNEPLYAGGNGTETTPYEIETWNHVSATRENLGANFTLAADLSQSTRGYDTVVTGANGFEPIGDRSAPFTGSFDGAGHVISNLTIDRPAENSVGLFSKLDHAATVEKVVIDDANITGNRVVGGLVGRNAGTVHNVTMTGNITGTKPNQYTNVGAIVGRHDAAGELVDVNASGSVTGHGNVGGLVGVSRGTVTRAHASVDVTADGEIAGGVVGYAFKPSAINHSNASGAVSGGGYVGGLVGYLYGEVTASSASGDTSATSSEVAGGLVGFAGQDSVINSSNASGAVSGRNKAVDAAKSVGGLVGFTNSTVTASSASGAVSGDRSVGGLVGFAGQSSMISRSSASGNVSARESSAGGLVGYLNSAVERSTASGDIEATETNVGGLVGLASPESSIARSNSTGTVSGENSVGGLVGWNRGAVNTSYATGGVTGVERVGGLIGIVGGTVEDTYAAPTAGIRGDERVGGLVGYIDDTGQVNRSFATGLVNATGSKSGGIRFSSPGVVSDSYWNVETTNQSSSDGGIPLATVQMTGDDALDDGNMDALSDGVWATVDESTAGSSGDGYPVLAALPLDPQILVPTRETSADDPSATEPDPESGGGENDSNDESGSSDASGSSGGGDGGGSRSDSATSPLAETVHTQTLEHTALNEIAIDFAEPVDGLVQVTVVEAPDRPTIESSATVVGAVSITPPRESTETNATLAFTLNATGLEASEIVPGDIVVYRVDTAGTVHDPITVSVTAETNDTVTVAVETPGFSTFVLATAQLEAETELEASQSESATEMTDGSPTKEPHGEPEPTTEDSPATIEADNVAVPGFGPLVALVALVMLALAAVERSRNQP
ncbi:GLUG motif-containing protein [Halorubrum sp. 2020YC2]|uniref:GLUG motif-containing protein n=1 Tax=Halorubrum sp. 2020YC2 TaxID=2836432 RepID=UPI001BE9FF5A|nr:GLUG motif-containing protein [Halorubrum sp. 2020YC2]QWC19154.1 hypothetical protein KI388_13750 [Halorubrum sp. 2020YC2]